jgi:hypothetical protein
MNFKSCILIFVTPLLLSGCGGAGDVDYGPLGTVSGKVTFQGAPLAEGQILIEKQGGGGSGGAEIQPDGTYKVVDTKGGVSVGTYNVSIVPPTVEKDLGPNTPPTQEPKEMANLPKKYHTFETSGLTVEIKEGENTKDFDLTP